MNDLLKFITCGSVDDGKSTLIGHILYDAKLLFADQEKALVLDSKVGSREGAIDYSLLLDGLMAEREQGITIDVAYRYFTTDNRSFIVADTPGHEEYTRNMAVGASFADLAIILVDATQGVLVQTKRHARICNLMGIRYFVFAVNKMDLANYDRKTFDGIQKQIEELSKELGLTNVKIIPVSATAGDNVTVKSNKMPWYDGEPILTYLENVDIKKSETEQGFYMPVQRVCRPNHTFRGFQGQIESGEISVGDELTVLPSGETAVAKSIFVGDRESQSAFIGQPVTITLDREIDVSRGCVLTKDSNIQNAKAFNATLLWMDDTDLTLGKEYFVKLGTKKIAGKIKKVLYKTDVNTGERIDANTIGKNEIALCEIVLDEEIPADLFKKHKTLGELILIDRVSNMTSACGVVDEIIDDDENFTVVEGNGQKVKLLIFDEFFYSDTTSSVSTYSNKDRKFKIGDSIPLKGESYSYPSYFDIVSVANDAAIEIRDGKIVDVKPIEKYKYIGLPIVNSKGFAVKIKSENDFEEFLKDSKTIKRQDLFEKWMLFDTYRRIIFTNSFWGI